MPIKISKAIAKYSPSVCLPILRLRISTLILGKLELVRIVEAGNNYV
jgi:hypothetical protein